MSFSQNREPAFLKPEEASAVEAAVRTAVRSILKVFWELNEKRAHCYEVKLAEAERENAELKFQLKTAEQELQTLRHISANYTISAERAFSPDASEGRGGEEEEEGASFQSDGSLVIKEEPCLESALCLKSEMADETFAAECDYPLMDNVQMCQQTPDAEMWSMQNLQTLTSARSTLNQTKEKWISADVLTGRLKSRECVRRYRERLRADPEKYHAWKEKERLRYHQRKKTIKDLSEPMKKLKRKAWREAKKRHRARKQVQATATRSAGSTECCSGDLLTCNEKEHSRSLRRRKRIQDLPEPMQKLQRKAWREATRRHRARKMTQESLTASNMSQTLNPS